MCGGENPVKQKGGALATSPTCITPIMNPPSYGAQGHQDALWKGGNNALPPGWEQYDIGGDTRYQDNNLFTSSPKRPLPGVRLDLPGQLLVPRCEWYISPLGRSYFVNHNTRTTSWEKPTPELPPGSWTPEYIIEGHSKLILALAYMGISHNVTSGSQDGLIRQWKRDGKPIGQPWRSDGEAVMSMAVSQDETMVVSGSHDGRIRLWNIKEGRVIGDPWEGHNAPVRCLDWSSNGQEIASGSEDGTIRRWNPSTGRQITPPIEAGQGPGWLTNVKYSPQDGKFASCGPDNLIRVWSKDGNLLTMIKGHVNWVTSFCWSKDGTCILSGSADCTIRRWRSIDGEELVVLRGHTRPIRSICLSLDGRHLVSASRDCSIRIWDLWTNQLVGEPLLHRDEVHILAMSSDGKYMASAGSDMRIYLWNFEAALKRGGNQTTHDIDAQSGAELKQHVLLAGDNIDISTQRLDNNSLARYGDTFWGINTNRSTHVSAQVTSSSPRRPNLFNFLRFNPEPVHSSPQILQRRRRNFRLSTGRVSSHMADVAAAHDVDRYYVSPPTEAEMAAAMQDGTGNEVKDAAHHDGAATGVQESQRGLSTQITQGQNSVVVTDEPYVIGCCGFYLVRRHPRSS